MHIVRTSDGRTFSDTRLFFDRAVIQDSRYANLKWMPGQNLRVSFTGPNLNGPEFTPVSEPIAGDNAAMFTDPSKSMAEGPSRIRRKGGVGAEAATAVAAAVPRKERREGFGMGVLCLNHAQGGGVSFV